MIRRPPRAALAPVDPLRVRRRRDPLQRVPRGARTGAAGDADGTSDGARGRRPARAARARYPSPGSGIPHDTDGPAIRAGRARARALRTLSVGTFWHSADGAPERPADPAQRRANLRRIGPLFAPYRRRLGGILLLIVVSASLGVVPAFMLKPTLDAI